MSRDQAFAESDHRHYNRHGEMFSQGETFSGVPFEQSLNFVEEIRPLVPPDMTMAQMAMRWLLDHPAVSTVITGATWPAQVAENASVSDLAPLSPELHDRLAQFYRAEVAPAICVPV